MCHHGILEQEIDDVTYKYDAMMKVIEGSDANISLQIEVSAIHIWYCKFESVFTEMLPLFQIANCAASDANGSPLVSKK